MKKKLCLSPEKKITGLCAGIGDYLNIDPTLIRVFAIGIALATAVLPAFFVYLIMSLVLPKPDEDYFMTHPTSGKRLYKSRDDKRLAGVCGGIAETYNRDSTVIRLIWALSFIIIGYGLWLYIASAIIIPKKDDVI